jgi:hypothetical protein
MQATLKALRRYKRRVIELQRSLPLKQPASGARTQSSQEEWRIYRKFEFLHAKLERVRNKLQEHIYMLQDIASKFDALETEVKCFVQSITPDRGSMGDLENYDA